MTFLGATSTGIYRSSMRVVVGSQVFVVPISATVTQVGPPL